MVSTSWDEEDAGNSEDTCPVCQSAVEVDPDTGRCTCGCGTFRAQCEECGKGFNEPGPLCEACARDVGLADD